MIDTGFVYTVCQVKTGAWYVMKRSMKPGSEWQVVSRHETREDAEKELKGRIVL